MSRVIYFEHTKPTAKIKARTEDNTDYYEVLDDIPIKTPLFLSEYKQDIDAVIRLLARYVVPYIMVIATATSLGVYFTLCVIFFINSSWVGFILSILLLASLINGFIFWVYLAKNRIFYR